MYILNRTVDLDITTIVNIYFIIGIIITILMYEELVKRIAKEIEDNSYIFAALTSDQVNNFTPLLMIIVWPLAVIGFIIGVLEAIINTIFKSLNK